MRNSTVCACFEPNVESENAAHAYGISTLKFHGKHKKENGPVYGSPTSELPINLFTHALIFGAIFLLSLD